MLLPHHVEARAILKSLDRPCFYRFCNVLQISCPPAAWELPAEEHPASARYRNALFEDEMPRLMPEQVLILQFAEFAATVLLWSEAGIILALQKMQTDLSLADSAQRIYEIYATEDIKTTIPRINIGMADHRYLTWTGYDKFYEPAAAREVTELQNSPAYATTYFGHVMLFRFFSALEKLRKDSQHAHPTSPG